jgi:hypothetical protein
VLFGRYFFNCSQRQALVMLAERERPVHLLFHRCLVSTDEIVRQIIKGQRPKYDFDSGLLAPEDLARIGVVAHETAFESFADARGLLLEVVDQQGYAIVVGDVFYWPHCPEYRKKHLVHTIVLRGFDPETGRWSILDDNPASVLCEYAYPESVIADGFDNGELRRIRHYTLDGYDLAEAERGAGAAYSRLVAEHADSGALLARLDEIVSDPWIASERIIAQLHDAFSLYQGSRIGVLEYVRRSIGDLEAETALEQIVKQAADVQGQLLIGKVTGTVDPALLGPAGRGLDAAEKQLLNRLAALDAGLGKQSIGSAVPSQGERA